ncbi:MAG: hypothetical protein BZ138_07450 [Methanosphaera sp. rholeuAM270]|nr:MAG: hypothetical protein BZ138_07450 [Methanosphaera sp. rholeuAM270]
METISIKGNWTATAPIHHGGSDDYGTTKLIHVQPTVVRNSITGEQEIDNIPCIHGNAVRGMLRRLVLDDFLTQIDYQLESKKVYHFLFTGGLLEAIDSADKGSINLTKKKEIRKYIPPLSLLGSALGNQMLQGKLKVGIGNIVCDETKHYIEEDSPESFSAYNLKSIDFGTRLDDLEIGRQIERNEDAEDQENPDQHNQMKYEFESLIRGTKFTHEFILEDMLPHEYGCFSRMLELWHERPYIGGKSNTGYGKIKFEYNVPSDLPGSQVYLDYLEENKTDIQGFLGDLCKIWK